MECMHKCFEAIRGMLQILIFYPTVHLFMHSGQAIFLGAPLPLCLLLRGQTWWDKCTWRAPYGNTHFSMDAANTALGGHDVDITGMCSFSATQRYKSGVHMLYSFRDRAVFHLSIQYYLFDRLICSKYIYWMERRKTALSRKLYDVKQYEHRTCTVVLLRSCTFQ